MDFKTFMILWLVTHLITCWYEIKTTDLSKPSNEYESAFLLMLIAMLPLVGPAFYFGLVFFTKKEDKETV